MVDSEVNNDQPYCYRVKTKVGDAHATSLVQCTTPKADPHPPHGVVAALAEDALMLQAQILPNALQNALPNAVPVTLRLLLDATDDPTTEEHPVFDGRFLFPDAQISGVTEMMISNRADFEGAEW